MVKMVPVRSPFDGEWVHELPKGKESTFSEQYLDGIPGLFRQPVGTEAAKGWPIRGPQMVPEWMTEPLPEETRISSGTDIQGADNGVVLVPEASEAGAEPTGLVEDKNGSLGRRVSARVVRRRKFRAGRGVIGSGYKGPRTRSRMTLRP